MPYACITGATSGIGLSFARHYAQHGFDLILNGRRSPELTRIKQQISTEFGRDIVLVIGDLSDRSTQDSLLTACSDREVHTLVNNAGFGRTGTFLEDELEPQLTMFEVHCAAAMRFCWHLGSAMVKRGSGTIINVSSLAAWLPAAGNGPYCASKSALGVFSRSLAIELGPKGVRVLSLHPGFTHTDFHDRLPDFTYPRKNKGLIRWQTPDQVVAAAIRALARKNKTVCIPGFSNRLLLRLVRLLPIRLYDSIAAKVEV